MTSEVSICNIALSRVGDNSIISLTEDSKTARLCNLLYKDTRNALLREHAWNFATTRVELALLSSTPSFGYSYEHQLPSDCIRALVAESDEYEITFKIESGKVLSNHSSVNLRYIRKVTDPNKYDSSFVDTLSSKLASEMVISLADNKGLKEILYKEYIDKLAEARAMDSHEGTPDEILGTTWLEARI